MGVSKLSYYTYKIFPKLEMKLGGFLYEIVKYFRPKGKRANAEHVRSLRRGFGKT